LCEFAWVGGVDAGADQAYQSGSWNISPKPKLNGGNNMGWKSADADKVLLDQLSTIDTKQRIADLDTYQKLIMDDAPTLPLFLRPNTTAVTTKLVNFKPPLTSAGETWNVADWDLQQ
jgi:ABC-type transport system substrate-binding protein